MLKRIRTHTDTPVLMLTARGDDVDRIVGLEMGRTTISPSRSIRGSWSHGSGPYFGARAIRRERPRWPRQRSAPVGDVEMETGTRIVLRDGEPVSLTAAEFSLLEILLGRGVYRHAG